MAVVAHHWIRPLPCADKVEMQRMAHKSRDGIRHVKLRQKRPRKLRFGVQGKGVILPMIMDDAEVGAFVWQSIRIASICTIGDDLITFNRETESPA